MPKITYYWDELSDNVAAEYEDGILSASYTHEPGLYGNLLSQKRNGVTSYYHYDGRGDTVALTDDSGNVTDTKEYDAWGNVIASMGSTVTSYLNVGRRGYQSEANERFTYVRQRWLQSGIGRWSAFDPLLRGLGAWYQYASNNPIMLIDASGLLDCYCDGQCEFPSQGLGFETKINQIVNAEIATIFRSIWPTYQPEACACPLSNDPIGGDSRAHQFRQAIRTLLGSNSDNPYALMPFGGIDVTRIEESLHNFTYSRSSGITKGPRKSVPGVGVYDTADCMAITCGGKQRCIGSDKIGHFFQQRFMGYELERAGLGEWVTGFFQFTEGLPITPTPGKQIQINGVYMHFHEWLRNGRFWFFGYGDRAVWSYNEEWGPIQKSNADVAANLAGTKFYQNAPELCECALWMSKNQGPVPPQIKCFNICDYITDAWVE